MVVFLPPVEITEAEEGFKIINKQRKINWGVGYKLEGKKKSTDERRKDREIETGLKREKHRKFSLPTAAQASVRCGAAFRTTNKKCSFREK